MNTLSYKTASIRNEDVEKQWWLIDAEDVILGRLASEAAKLVRGKHKPSFTPHIDCGDQVIVINAEKVKMTGKKWDQKTYVRYTGHPGGQRTTLAKEMRAKHPIRLIEFAVKGMLPKNKLGRKIYKNLHVYAGSEHPHAGQQPKTFEVK
jgi:large subunit ribosomal protein L13